jgi:microsomal prostaglandin-E synthase 2
MQGGGGARNMATTVLRAVAQRSARAEASGARALRTLAVSESQSQSEQGFVAQLNSALENPSRREQDPKRSWNGRWMTGAFAVSFAASTMTVAYGKERVADKFAPKEVVLYQYDACPFCNKVKAFLDYHDIAYKVVEVNPMGKKEIKWSEYKKVPILVVDGEALNDSTAIITELTRRIEGENAGVLESEEEDKWRRWVDEHLVHLLSPNIYRSPREALQAFDYLTTSGNFSAMERATGKYFGAAAMYVIGKRLKKRHNIVDERASLYDAADEWVKALDGRQFMGGSKPNLADLAVFGVLRPIRNLDTGRDLMATTKIGDWYARMENAVGAAARLQEEPLMGTIDSSIKV